MSFQKLKFACGSGAASSNPRTFFRKAVASICRDLDNLKAEWEMSRAVS
jgi:galactitol-specific phosphotransferase system IIB component